MTNVARLYDVGPPKKLFGEARILTVDNEKRVARIYLEDFSGIQEIEAVIATSQECVLASGDTVLVAVEDIDQIFIIGVITSKTPSKLFAESGSCAVLAESDDRSKFQIFSKDNELVLEYDETQQKTTINCRAGDLELLAPAGNISLKSSESIELSGEIVSLKSKKRINHLVQEHAGGPASSFSIGNYQTKMSCPDLRIASKRGTLFIDDLMLAGKKVLGNLVKATITAEHLETRTQTIINKTKNLFQSVEKLTQLKTGRLKTLIQQTYHLKSKNTVLKSEDDFKVKAKKINLG